MKWRVWCSIEESALKDGLLEYDHETFFYEIGAAEKHSLKMKGVLAPEKKYRTRFYIQGLNGSLKIRNLSLSDTAQV